MPVIQITRENTLLSEVTIAGGSATIGRGPENDIRLGDITVSRFHARIHREASGKVRIEDNNSTNGVYLNDRRITGSAPLAHGDEIKIGAYVLTYLDSRTPAGQSQEMEHPRSSRAGAGRTKDEVGVLVNEANNAIFVIGDKKVTLGNHGEADIRVPSDEPIRASISRRGDQYYVCSETSQPCLRVNGTLIMNARLSYNDRIEIGGRRFIFREI